MSPAPKTTDVLAKKSELGTESNRYGFEVIDAIDKGELMLSISPLLGCDYLFINHHGVHELLSPRRVAYTLQEIMEILQLQPLRSAAIAAETTGGKTVFTRYSYTWENNRISHMSAVKVIQTEQIEFLLMMFNCSSMIEPHAIQRNNP